MGNVQTFLQESENIAARQNPILDTDMLFKKYFTPKYNLANIS